MKKYEISYLQYVFFIVQAQIGVGILTMPSDLAEVASTDGWISIILGWLIAMGVSLMIIQIMKRNPQETIFGLLPRYFGKWLGTAFSLLFILYSLISFTNALFVAVHVTQTWVLPQTANYYLVILFAIPSYMLAANGVGMLGRFAEFISYSMVWMLLLFFFALKQGHLIHLLPILKEGWLPVFKAVPKTILSFLGFEFAFILYPYLQKKERATRGIIIANTVSMLIFLLITLVCYIRFSPDQVVTYIWPTLNLFETLEFSFVERIEIIFSAFYLFVIASSGIPYLFIAVSGISQLLRKQDHRPPLLAFTVAFIVLSFVFNPTFHQVIQLQKWGAQFGTIMAYFFPVFLWLYVVAVDPTRWRHNK
ncbi:UNVERIFIED_CONTAM: spore germination protein (amino acid permease) [Brevibacillus sp. OAP136]